MFWREATHLKAPVPAKLLPASPSRPPVRGLARPCGAHRDADDWAELKRISEGDRTMTDPRLLEGLRVIDAASFIAAPVAATGRWPISAPT